MKSKEIEILIKHRIEQAHEALDDAKYLIEGNRSPRRIVPVFANITFSDNDDILWRAKS